ncbi:DNA mismatch repair endonuclease MutL [Anaerosacchariphilus polymeriproducens]|uniref:DNA mismatch repair protein MutL n=1 Tax=Anaerosacchariphilus polymeriproducens TaxID=1812858 RepID=A0A371AU54_9FIRM|nr:DNA mismatch repair endonuclease MutL [Anaerosacchariphilus polymeriproducens]RDU23069.1 DNA mismatch repair endonuclease MutL [Anaerosacchariphilus polymeriproducens]
MSNIAVLDQKTIDKIAAGEVIERPSSVVKELVENAIDAGSTAITVEIKEGGISFIRITDNGCGIKKEEVPLAFLRHSTSKIQSVEDLMTVSSLGFRGEALSSIAAVAQVELISKPAKELLGVRYIIEGSQEKSMEEIGAPDGTTFLIRNLFYNTPARQKFLKSPTTEGNYISELLQRLALSHPNISFKFINNGQIKLHTSGNTNLKDIIYHIYGREISKELLEIQEELGDIKIEGFIGKPVISRGNRNFENYFINGRYVKSNIISKGIEQAYKNFMMQHKYPFTVLHFSIKGELLDINVHPTKMELRFSNKEEIYQFIHDTVYNRLQKRELIPEVEISANKKPENKRISKMKEFIQKQAAIPEPFEKKRLETFKENNLYQKNISISNTDTPVPVVKNNLILETNESSKTTPVIEKESEQLELFDGKLLSKEAKAKHEIIGQVFDTYWIIQYQDKMFIMDQHAAHEKVLYEKTLASLDSKEHASQMISPPILITLSMKEQELLNKYLKIFEKIGFIIESFGGNEFIINGVPSNLFGLLGKDLFIEIIDGLAENLGAATEDVILEKIASMSCKAAVKGNHKYSNLEAQNLIEQLMELENPYHCPHGRPTIISMSKYELEKKFQRIL